MRVFARFPASRTGGHCNFTIQLTLNWNVSRLRLPDITRTLPMKKSPLTMSAMLQTERISGRGSWLRELRTQTSPFRPSTQCPRSHHWIYQSQMPRNQKDSPLPSKFSPRSATMFVWIPRPPGTNRISSLSGRKIVRVNADPLPIRGRSYERCTLPPIVT